MDYDTERHERPALRQEILISIINNRSMLISTCLHRTRAPLVLKVSNYSWPSGVRGTATCMNGNKSALRDVD